MMTKCKSTEEQWNHFPDGAGNGPGSFNCERSPAACCCWQPRAVILASLLLKLAAATAAAAVLAGAV
jgi:hypothetical protein